MNRGGRASRSSAAQSLGSADPRLRRNAQAQATDNDLGSGVALDDRGRISIALDVAGALYVRPDGTIGLRLGDGLTLAAGSPVAVRLVEDDGTVQVTARGLRARVTASQVTTDGGGTVEADLATKQDLAEKDQTDGYLGIGSTGYVDQTKLGSSYGGSGAKYLADDGKWKAAPTSYATLSITDNLVVSATSGEGIQIDPAAPTFPWHDLLGEVIVRGTGGTDPAYNTYIGTLRAHFFAVNDEVFFTFHIPHDYLPGSDIYIHAHWSQAAKTKAGAASGTVTGGTVTWGFETTYAKGHQQAAFSATVTPTVNQACNTTTYWHHIAEVQLSAASPSATQIDTDNLEVDGIILVRAYLSANGITVSSGSTPAPVLHFVDIHYQSTNVGTKNKSPGFYV